MIQQAPPHRTVSHIVQESGDNMDLERGGVKHDAGKPRYDLIAPEFLDELGCLLAIGADKYEPRNWEKGMRWGRSFAACMRHAWAFWRGEARDPETGVHHLVCAACNLMFLFVFDVRKLGEDDSGLVRDVEN